MYASKISMMAVAVAALITAGCSSETSSETPAATEGASAATTASATGSTSPPSETSAAGVAATSAPPTTGAASTPAPTTAAGATADAGITIEDFAYAIPSEVKAGDLVTITNADGSDHTFTDDAGTFDVAVSASGGTAELTAPAAGTYDVVCTIHPSMSGTLTVT